MRAPVLLLFVDGTIRLYRKGLAFLFFAAASALWRLAHAYLHN